MDLDMFAIALLNNMNSSVLLPDCSALISAGVSYVKQKEEQIKLLEEQKTHKFVVSLFVLEIKRIKYMIYQILKARISLLTDGRMLKGLSSMSRAEELFLLKYTQNIRILSAATEKTVTFFSLAECVISGSTEPVMLQKGTVVLGSICLFAEALADNKGILI